MLEISRREGVLFGMVEISRREGVLCGMVEIMLEISKRVRGCPLWNERNQ